MSSTLTPIPSPSGRGEADVTRSLRLRSFAPLRLNVLVFFFYLFLAIIITWPLVTVLGTRFAGYANGDAHEMTRHIWWFKHALQTGQPLFFQPLLAYPDGLEGVILWSNPLQFFPAWLFAFVMPLPAAYNVQALINLALNGCAAYFLARHLTRHAPAALVAGVVFMASPAIQGHLAGGHGGLLVQWPLPLLAYALVRLREQFPVASRQSPVLSHQSSVLSHQSNNTGLEKENLELSPQSSVFSPQSSVISPKNSELGTQNSELPTQYSALSTQHSALSTQHSVLSTQYSALSTLFLVLLPLGHTLQLVYAGLPLVGLFALALLVERNWRALWRLIAAVAAALLILLLFLLPVANATLGTAAYTDEGGSVAYSLDLLALVTPSFNHPLYGQWEYTHRVLGTNIVEGSAYAGVIVALLALVAVWKRREARWWLLLALAAWVLALGPLLKILDRPVSFSTDGYETFITLPWALLQDLPVFNLARTPGRFNFLLALAVSVLAGYGVASLQLPVAGKKFSVFGYQFSVFNSNQLSKNSALSPQSSVPNNSTLSTQYSVLSTLLLIALVLLDYQSFWPLPTYSAEIPQAVYDLSKRDDVRAVFNVPWDNVLAAKDALWPQIAHEKPLIAGHVSRKTPVDPAKLTILQETLDPALLCEAGADVVIVHKQDDDALAARVRETWGEPFYEDDRLALYDVPETDASPTFRPYPPNLVTNQPLAIGDHADGYVYVPEIGWVDITVTLSGAQPVILLLDRQPVHRVVLVADQPQTVSLDLPLAAPGYHTITLALETPCPPRIPDTMQCAGAEVADWSFSDYVPMPIKAVAFERGITLAGHYLVYNDHAPDAGQVSLSLWWQFDQPRTEQDVRFVKVLDKDGNQVAGIDETLGVHEAGSQWVETVTLDLPDNLAPGEYEVYTGWYTHPDLTRFGVLSDTPRAQDGLAYLGSVTVR